MIGIVLITGKGVNYTSCVDRLGDLEMGDQFHVEPLRPGDERGVPDLFREVYGDRYPVRTVYQPEQLAKAQARGDYFPFLVRGPGGKIVAFGALYRSAPYPGIYEFGQGVVSAEFRGAGIGRLLFEYVAQLLPNLPGAELYFGEAVCNHTHTQKAGALIGTIETGFEIDLLPGDLYAPEAESNRVAVVDMFKTLRPRPHTSYPPARYVAAAEFIYRGLDDERSLLPSGAVPASASLTELSSQFFEFAQVLRVAAPAIGADFPERFLAEERRWQGAAVRVCQVWLGLAAPGIEAAVEWLRGRGYFFGGIFPRWFGSDGLLMQRIAGQPAWEGIRPYSRRAEQILDFIHDDWEQVTRESPAGSGG